MGSADNNDSSKHTNTDQQWTGHEQSNSESSSSGSSGRSSHFSLSLSSSTSLEHLMQVEEQHAEYSYEYWQSSSSSSPQGITAILGTQQQHGKVELPLAANVNADAVDAYGRNVLHHVIQSYSKLSSLSSDQSSPNGHDDDNDDEKQGQRHNQNQAQQIIEAILASPSSPRACLQTTHDGGFTPLHLCLCWQYSSSSVTTLPIPDSITCAVASRNPRALFIQDEEGDTPLHTAFRYGASEDVIRVLIELAYSAECQSECALDFQLEREREHEHERNYPMTSTPTSLDDLGCEIDIDFDTETHTDEDHEDDEEDEDEDCTPFSKMNNDGDTPLHTAITHEGTCNSIRLLLDAHPHGMFLSKNMEIQYRENENEIDDDHSNNPCQHQLTPLHLAAEHGRYDVLEVMVQSHAATGAIEEVLAMRDGDGVNGISVIYMLWDRVCNLCDTGISSNRNNRSDDNDSTSSRVGAQPDLSLEIMEAIATLLNSTNYDDSEDGEKNNQDLAVYKLLQTSIRLGNNIVPPGYVSFLIQNHPDILRRADGQGRLPLHLAAMNCHYKCHSSSTSRSASMTTNEENYSLLQQDQDEEHILNYHRTLLLGEDTRDNTNGSYGFNDRGYNYGRWDHPFYMTPKELDRFSASGTGHHRHHLHHLSHIPRHRHHLNRSHGQMIKIILDEYPAAASIEDAAGRLPFHLAIEAGVPWNEMKNLLIVNPHVIQRKDPKTGLLPFMLAAANSYTANATDNFASTTNTTAIKPTCEECLDSDKLDTVYRLLQSSPDLILSSKICCNFNAVEGKGIMDGTELDLCVPSPSKRRRTMR
eukprot:CAMPEP_0203670290 /NCGR_PEP_ID=MMETSP0090-20130426/6409_1 /ASSEMBLY_ACC=CAM_ASM_001088 /TAXON_ID=426623 /ORGANISM="Chaetoceros affinis, Strain CCMP159" /LENGTH=813 /DNA_ID=CAMNT_0050535117 /DNA_START=348 /DNA_END=2789 /DNA_ORIENTATION=+